MNNLTSILLTGIGATAIMDAWGFLRRLLFGIPRPDYALVGRWFAHMRHGRFRHAAIARAPAAGGELMLGWVAHYLTGMAFAAVLVAVQGPAWFERPTLAPAMVVGFVTVLAPFLIMQPGMGAGFAASRTPRPWASRLQTVVTHAVFGVGLYAAGWALHVLSER